MQRSIPVITAFSLVLLSTAPAAAASVAAPAHTAAVASAQAAAPGEPVIVVLKHQYGFANDATGTRQDLDIRLVLFAHDHLAWTPAQAAAAALT